MRKKCFDGIFLISVPVAILFLFFTRNFWINISGKFPRCVFLEATGFYCTGCGNTRSVISLLHGDLLGSLRNNIAPAVIAVLLILLYAEFLIGVLCRKVKIVPRSGGFWCIFGIVVFLYYIFRNFIEPIAPV